MFSCRYGYVVARCSYHTVLDNNFVTKICTSFAFYLLNIFEVIIDLIGLFAAYTFCFRYYNTMKQTPWFEFANRLMTRRN